MNVLQVASNRLICVYVNPMSLFILLSHTILSTCFENDHILCTKTVNISSDMVYLFIVENKSFCFRRSYSSNASLFTFIEDF